MNLYFNLLSNDWWKPEHPGENHQFWLAGAATSFFSTMNLLPSQSRSSNAAPVTWFINLKLSSLEECQRGGRAHFWSSPIPKSSATRSSLITFLLLLPVFFLRSKKLDLRQEKTPGSGKFEGRTLHFSNHARRNVQLWAQRSSPELQTIFGIQIFFECDPSSATSLLSEHEENMEEKKNTHLQITHYPRQCSQPV